MTALVRPLDIFTKAAFRSSCVWLDAYTSHTGERPCWQWMWNRADHRITNEEGAMAMVDRVRMNKLQSPSIICGDVSKFDKQAKEFYREHQCVFTKGSEECRTALSACLDQIVKAEPLTGSGIGPPPTLVLGGLTGRVDRAMATIHSLVPAQTTASSSVSAANPSYVLDGNNLVCFLPKGQHHLSLTPRAFLTEVCGIAPICQRETRVTTRGFRWNLDNASLSFGDVISTSNELANDEVEITTSAPIMLTLDLLGSVTNLDEPPT